MTKTLGNPWRFAACMLMLVTCAAEHADASKATLVRPNATAKALRLANSTTDAGVLYASFNGQVWIEGTFVVRWPAGAAAPAYKQPDFKLVPNKKAAATLPHFVISDAAYKSSYLVREIELSNGEDAMRMAFSATQIANILGRKVDSIHVSGRFLIDAYAVGVECDAPWAKANLVKAELPEQVGFGHSNAAEGC